MAERAPDQHAGSAKPTGAPGTPAPRTRKAASTSVPRVAEAKPAAQKAAAQKAAALKVRSDEGSWTVAELAVVRAMLEEAVARIRAEIEEADLQLADLVRDSGDGAGDDQADSGSKAFEREHGMNLANNARDLLLQDERALERIADGTYGTCESCGEGIGKRRLLAFPRATMCLPCKQRQERR